MGCSKNYLQKSQLEPIMKWSFTPMSSQTEELIKCCGIKDISCIYNFIVSVYIYDDYGIHRIRYPHPCAPPPARR